METTENHPYISSRNACKLCAPLGAGVAYKGIKGCVSMLHGSQGCTTYIRRYLISHYKEPVDIASSNFSEESTIFGGGENFSTGLKNIISQYNPEIIGIASTCLSETIGEDIPGMIKAYTDENKEDNLPVIVCTSTPSYQGSHIDGFHDTCLSVISSLSEKGNPGNHINMFPGFISPEDIRHIKDILSDFDLDFILFPDYSDTLDNPHWEEYQLIPEGGTSLDDIRRSGSAAASIEFGYVFNKGRQYGKIRETKPPSTAAEWLEHNYCIKNQSTGMPVGIKETDRFFKILEGITGRQTPLRYERQRGRLIDSYIDGHKHLFGKKAIVYGEEDLVAGIVSFLEEIGIDTVLAVSGGESGILTDIITRICNGKATAVLNGGDFEIINEMADDLKPDLMIGNSKGYYIARRLNIPLVRIGFPVHDRIGGQRIKCLCYEGTQQLFDRVTNALIQKKQDSSPVGYKYI